MAQGASSGSRGNSNYILIALIVVLAVVLLYFSFGTGQGTVVGRTTSVAGGLHQQSTYSSSLITTIPFNSSQYTTTPPPSYSTADNISGQFEFVNSGTLGAQLGMAYNQSNISATVDGPGVLASYSDLYYAPDSYILITLSQFNNTAYAYTTYNQTYNTLYAWAHENGHEFYYTTYANASYFITNESRILNNGTRVNLYASIGLYSDYIIAINTTQFNSRMSLGQLEGLMEVQVQAVTG